MSGQGMPHINDVVSDLVEKLTIVSSEIIKIKNIMNDLGDRYDAVLAENAKIKSDITLAVEKTMKSAIVKEKIKYKKKVKSETPEKSSANTDIPQPS